MNRPYHRLTHIAAAVLTVAAAGAHGAALRVRLAAPPVDGKANQALLAWAAQAFGLAKSRVELMHGAAGRQKVLGVRFDSQAELQAAQALVARWRASGGDDDA